MTDRRIAVEFRQISSPREDTVYALDAGGRVWVWDRISHPGWKMLASPEVDIPSRRPATEDGRPQVITRGDG